MTNDPNNNEFTPHQPKHNKEVPIEDADQVKVSIETAQNKVTVGIATALNKVAVDDGKGIKTVSSMVFNRRVFGPVAIQRENTSEFPWRMKLFVIKGENTESIDKRLG